MSAKCSGNRKFGAFQVVKYGFNVVYISDNVVIKKIIRYITRNRGPYIRIVENTENIIERIYNM